MEKTHTVMEKWGYTGSACIPMALDDALEQGKVKPGDLVVFVGSGVGYNQAGAAFRMAMRRGGVRSVGVQLRRPPVGSPVGSGRCRAGS